LILMSQAPADIAINARWIAPVEGPRLLEHHSLVIRGEQIVDLLPTTKLADRWQAKQTLRLPQHLLIPGFVNAHAHAAMVLMRGLADDLPLMDWLEKHIWPAESRHVSEAFVQDGVSLACAGMITSGTTCFADMYFFPHQTAKAASQAGVRACLFSPLLDFPSAMAQNSDDYIAHALRLSDDWQHDPLIQVGFGPHAPYTVSDDPLKRIVTLAAELDCGIMMHVHETADEVRKAEQQGERPLARLKRLGLLGPRLLAVHMTQVSDDEVRLLADTGTRVVHCPESNLKLASGFCPVERLRRAGVSVALGTDGAASNNDLDMLGEMRTASLLAKGVAGDACALPADAALTMATLGGAKALGMEEFIGSLKVGKLADITAVDLGAINTQPIYDPISQLVYAAGRHQVSHVWVNGRPLLSGGRLTTLNPDDLLQRSQRWATLLGAPS
jgi:5-methylthioadenosine/S-adenosylhomocysteine deaminase